MRFITLVVVLFNAVPSLFAQTYLFAKTALVDRITRQSVVLSQPTGLTSSVKLIFPTVAGATNQALFVSSVSGNEVTLGWASTSSSTSTTNTDRLAADQVTTAPAGLTVSLSPNRAYRYVSTFRAARDNGATSDNFRIQVSGPTGLSFLSMAARAVTQDATTATTGVPFYSSTTSATSITSGDINPTGTSGTGQNIVNIGYVYQAEGVVVTGSTTGSLTLTVVRESTGTPTLNVTIFSQASLVVTEIQ